MNTSTYEKTIKELFIGKCWEYLDKNFSKFTETNKIKIALELCKKDVPQEVNGNLNCMVMPSIKTADGKEIKFNVGIEPDSPGDTKSPGEATPSDNEV